MMNFDPYNICPGDHAGDLFRSREIERSRSGERCVSSRRERLHFASVLKFLLLSRTKKGKPALNPYKIEILQKLPQAGKLSL